ncbi:MAG: tandem-95 repeat protein [Gammaproteobacteria bacterium]|nr:tandem-95 repeat protein [Gammaproteobacteria bacterium]
MRKLVLASAVAMLVTQVAAIDAFAVAAPDNSTNQPPIANPDSASTPYQTPVTIAVLANDSDPDGNSLGVGLRTNGAHGKTAKTHDTVTYTPKAGFYGTDTFTYIVADGRLGHATGTVTVTVGPPSNFPPKAVDDNVSTRAGEPVSIDVLSNDTDPEGDAIAITATSKAANGTRSRKGAIITYTPKPGFVGTDTLRYAIVDSNNGPDVGRLNITVLPESAPKPEPIPLPTQQPSGGSVTIEAEQFSVNFKNGAQWIGPVSPAGASGGKAMEAPLDGQPRLEYQVNFSQSGTYYVWIRSYALNASTNSVRFGVDGSWSDAVVSVSPYNSWQWEGPFAMTVASKGIHTLGITRRESSTLVDKIFIGTSSTADPSGTEPDPAPAPAPAPDPAPAPAPDPAPAPAPDPAPAPAPGSSACPGSGTGSRARSDASTGSRPGARTRQTSQSVLVDPDHACERFAAGARRTCGLRDLCPPRIVRREHGAQDQQPARLELYGERHGPRRLSFFDERPGYCRQTERPLRGGEQERAITTRFTGAATGPMPQRNGLAFGRDGPRPRAGCRSFPRHDHSRLRDPNPLSHAPIQTPARESCDSAPMGAAIFSS